MASFAVASGSDRRLGFHGLISYGAVHLDTTTFVLYHFDQVFTILENSVSEKAEELSFELRRILKQPDFLTVTCD
jgi:hypothetical protein